MKYSDDLLMMKSVVVYKKHSVGCTVQYPTIQCALFDLLFPLRSKLDLITASVLTHHLIRLPKYIRFLNRIEVIKNNLIYLEDDLCDNNVAYIYQHF